MKTRADIAPPQNKPRDMNHTVKSDHTVKAFTFPAGATTFTRKDIPGLVMS